jgi:toxin ParE1/3/4
MKLRFAPRGAENIAAIADYVSVRNRAAARHVRNILYDSLQNLILFPHVGRPQQMKGAGKLVTHKYKYLIYYTVDEGADEIEILNVKHPAQKREHEDF